MSNHGGQSLRAPVPVLAVVRRDAVGYAGAGLLAIVIVAIRLLDLDVGLLSLRALFLFEVAYGAWIGYARPLTRLADLIEPAIVLGVIAVMGGFAFASDPAFEGMQAKGLIVWAVAARGASAGAIGFGIAAYAQKHDLNGTWLLSTLTEALDKFPKQAVEHLAGSLLSTILAAVIGFLLKLVGLDILAGLVK